MFRRIVPTAVLALIVLAAPVAAAPLPEAQRIPVDLRRTTLVVRDIDRSLPLYRDALGLRVIYDEKLGGPTGPDGKLTAPTTRLVLLRANDDFIGVLGLMQRLNVSDPVPEPVFRKAQPGGLILVFNVQDLEARFERIRATPHVKVAEAPLRVEYPAPGGGVIPVMFSAIWDADGNFVELNRILGTPAGQAAPAAQGTAAERRP
jgi:catechol 2,3-dioxygenase-like lactoylglutathione lyase family enzyme